MSLRSMSWSGRNPLIEGDCTLLARIRRDSPLTRRGRPGAAANDGRGACCLSRAYAMPSCTSTRQQETVQGRCPECLAGAQAKSRHDAIGSAPYRRPAALVRAERRREVQTAPIANGSSPRRARIAGSPSAWPSSMASSFRSATGTPFVRSGPLSFLFPLFVDSLSSQRLSECRLVWPAQAPPRIKVLWTSER